MIPVIGMAYTGVSVASGVTSLVRSRSQSSARRFAWLLTAVAIFDVLSAATIGSGNNLWLSHINMPVIAVLMAWAAVRFMSTERAVRLTLAGAALYLVLWIALGFRLEVFRSFSTATGPLLNIYGTLVGVSLVFSAIRLSSGSPFQMAGAWIGLGLVATHAPALAVEPIMNRVMKHSVEDAKLVWQGYLAACTVGTVLMLIPFLRKRIVWPD